MNGWLEGWIEIWMNGYGQLDEYLSIVWFIRSLCNPGDCEYDGADSRDAVQHFAS